MNLYTLYTIDDCIYCTALKSKLAEAGIKYKEVKDNETLNFKGFQTVPQLDIGSETLDYYAAIEWLAANQSKGEQRPKFLSKEFLSKYPSHPAHLNQLGLFTFYRTYSRFLPELRRRETWKETVARAVEYNIGLDYAHRKNIDRPIPTEWLKKEAEEVDFLNILYSSNYLSDFVKESIKNKLSKKKLTVKDKQFIQDLLENIYIRSEFMDSDTKDVVEFKKAEIVDFIKDLKK